MTIEQRAHPWMALSAPGALQQMLDEIGVKDVASVFEQILRRPLSQGAT